MKAIKFISLLAGLIIHTIAHGQTIPNEEDWSKLPPSVDPGNSATPPSDVIILFEIPLPEPSFLFQFHLGRTDEMATEFER